MEIFRAEGFTGTNVTSPFKDEIMDYTDLPDSISSILGSANTIISKNGKLYSYNTDYFGVKNTLEAFLPAAGNTGAQFCAPEGTHPHLRNNGAHFCAPEKLTALVVGAGGAGKAAALAVKDMGMEVYFANRSSSAAKPFAQKIGAEFVSLDHIPLLLPKADIVVYNLSMEIDPLKGVSLADKIVFEANYAHPNLACKESKIYIDGRYWLYNQAIPAFRLFTGEEPDTTAMAQVMGL
jgi:shikimate dehydrogenase